MELKKLMLLCQLKLHMKPTITHYSVNQQCEVHQIFVFYILHCSLKVNDHIGRNINVKKKCLYVKSIFLLF